VDDPEITSFRYDCALGGRRACVPCGVRPPAAGLWRADRGGGGLPTGCHLPALNGLFTWPLPRLLRTAPTVVEINTNDVVEYRYRGRFITI
jgi:hypothetical protein